MGVQRLDREAQGTGRRRPPTASERAPDPPAQAVLALPQGAGNAAVARMLSPSGGARVIARTMRDKVSFTALSQGDLTPAKLRVMKATLDTAIADISTDVVQASFADMGRIAGWIANYDTALTALLTEIGSRNPPDPERVGVPFTTAQAKGDALARALWAVVVPLGNIRHELNEAFDLHKKHVANKEAEEAEAEFAYEVPAEFLEKGKAKATASKPVAKGAKELVEGDLEFPHKGKHAPPPKAVDEPTALMEITAEKGAVAVYKTNNTKKVLTWEAEARSDGWTLFDGKTVVHGFKEEVGADHGEMTRFIRLDGDHGHPIIEDHQILNTSFTAYMKKEVLQAKGDAARLGAIFDYLTSIGFPPHTVGLRNRPPATAAIASNNPGKT